MWINVPEHLQELNTDDLDGPVDLSDGETVQVTKEVGELLIEYDGISERDTEDN